MVYTKIKLKNHRVTLKKVTYILWAASNFSPNFEILSFKTDDGQKKKHIMGKIFEILVYNWIKTVFSKSSLFGRQSVLKKHLPSVGETL